MQNRFFFPDFLLSCRSNRCHCSFIVRTCATTTLYIYFFFTRFFSSGPNKKQSVDPNDRARWPIKRQNMNECARSGAEWLHWKATINICQCYHQSDYNSSVRHTRHSVCVCASFDWSDLNMFRAHLWMAASSKQQIAGGGAERKKGSQEQKKGKKNVKIIRSSKTKNYITALVK